MRLWCILQQSAILSNLSDSYTMLFMLSNTLLPELDHIPLPTLSWNSLRMPNMLEWKNMHNLFQYIHPRSCYLGSPRYHNMRPLRTVHSQMHRMLLNEFLYQLWLVLWPKFCKYLHKMRYFTDVRLWIVWIHSCLPKMWPIHKITFWSLSLL